ncbi:MAG TPA: hypothetical protein VGJ15_12650, partial [Pirellulales bacterium]
MDTMPAEPMPNNTAEHPPGSDGTAGLFAGYPRLSIRHLLVWTALSAAIYRLVQIVQNGFDSVSLRPFRWLQSGSLIVLTMAIGASIGSIPFFIQCKRRRLRFPITPGQWLWLTHGISMIGFIALWRCMTYLMRNYFT